MGHVNYVVNWVASLLKSLKLILIVLESNKTVLLVRVDVDKCVGLEILPPEKKES